MKDNTLRESNAKVNRTVNELETITYYKHHYVRKTGLKKAIKALLAEEVRKAIEKIAQESTVNFFGIQEGSDISTKKKWVQVIKTQDILEQLEKGIE